MHHSRISISRRGCTPGADQWSAKLYRLWSSVDTLSRRPTEALAEEQINKEDMYYGRDLKDRCVDTGRNWPDGKAICILRESGNINSCIVGEMEKDGKTRKWNSPAALAAAHFSLAEACQP